jgi:hypothetical protein
LIENSSDCWWPYWCPNLTFERWQKECRLVEERFSLFRPFAEAPFLGFRGIVARAGSEYHVTVAAEMDMYPKYQPWACNDPGNDATEDQTAHVDLSHRASLWNHGSIRARGPGGNDVPRGCRCSKIMSPLNCNETLSPCKDGGKLGGGRIKQGIPCVHNSGLPRVVRANKRVHVSATYRHVVIATEIQHPQADQFHTATQSCTLPIF